MNAKQALLFILALPFLLVACNTSDQTPLEQEVDEVPPVETVEVRIVDWNSEQEPRVDTLDYLTIADPYSTIDRIFSSYITFQASSDANENKDSLKYAIQQIGDGPGWIDSTSLQLLLNVWMYYDPTDFPVRNYIETRLKEDVSVSTAAVDERMRHKKEWENQEHAPFAELPYLRELLIDSDSE